MSDSDANDRDDSRPSKSERKRQMHALQEMGERLVSLPQADLDRIQIDDERLREAVEMARGIKARGALKRQLQFIGKLMRDNDLTLIQTALQQITPHLNNGNARIDFYEEQAQRILLKCDTAIDEILDGYPNLDRQKLRQLSRAYSKADVSGRDRIKQKLISYLQQTWLSRKTNSRTGLWDWSRIKCSPANHTYQIQSDKPEKCIYYK